MTARFLILLNLFALLLVSNASAGSRAVVRKVPSAYQSYSQRAARLILSNPRIDLLSTHVSGRTDNATAKANIQYVAAGHSARRSSYGTAPGGEVALDPRMLGTMVNLASRGFSYRVTEVAGGSHSRNSLHYRGSAFDVDKINDMEISYGNPHIKQFLGLCRGYGAKQLLGPGDRGHSTHIHAGWAENIAIPQETGSDD